MKHKRALPYGLSILLLVLCCTLVLGALGVQALTMASTYILLDFTEGNEECNPDFWAALGDVRTLSNGNFDASGRFRAIIKAGSDGLAQDPFVGMKIDGSYKLGYKVNSGDILQINFRYRDMAYDTSARPTGAQVFYAGPETTNSSGNVAYQEKYSNSFTTDYSHENYQIHSMAIDSDMVGKVLDYIRFDGISGGSTAFDISDNAGWMIDYIYIGPAASAPNMKVTYQYKSASNGSLTSTEWVAKGGKPVSVPTPEDIAISGDTATTRYSFKGTWGGKTPAQVKNTAINQDTTFHADYTTEYKVFYRNYRASFTSGPADRSEWIASGGTPVLLEELTNSLTRTNTEKTERYRLSVIVVDEVSYAPRDTLTLKITKPTNFWFGYDTQYPVRYLNGSTQLQEDWIIKGKSNTKYTASDPTKSGYSHVGWVRTNSTATPSASAECENPGAVAITEATYYHARFLSNAFVGKDTNNLVVERSVTLKPGTTDAEHKYRLRLDIYHYGGVLTQGEVAGAMKGYFTLVDNLKADFFKVTKDLSVYALRYLGNGKFEDEATLEQKIANDNNGTWDGRLTAGGTNGFVFETTKSGSATVAWAAQNHAEITEPDHRYFTFHFSDGSIYTNAANQKATDYRESFYCREVAGNNPNVRRGYKYVIIVEFELDRDGTIGGNNVPLSHKTQHAQLNYFTSLSTSSAKTAYPLYKLYEAKGLEWPNANIEILYDFCLHDYYMDLYDVKVTQTIENGVMAKGDVILPGLVTILRDQANGKHGDNNRKVYGNLYSHGNTPVYARTQANVNSYNKLGLPNTDVNGIRNEKVTIAYSVKHDSLNKVVYETKCEAYDVGFSITNEHPEVVVDFLTDHSVTVSCTVTPVDTGHTDSFGRSSKDTVWTASAKAYYFAPRIAVADTGNNISVKMQTEAKGYSSTKFTAAPSIMYGTRSVPTVRILSTEASGAYSPSNGNQTYLLYSFNDSAYSYRQKDPQILNGIRKVGYTVQAINTPKRFVAGTTMENKDIVQRYYYILPATNIAYDQHYLSFDREDQWLMSKETNSYVSLVWQQYFNYPLYGADKYTLDSYWKESNTAEQQGNHLDFNGGSVYTNVDDASLENRNEGGQFTFTGTGFDILTRSDPSTGVLVVQVYRVSDGKQMQNIFIDTYLNDETFHQAPAVQWTAPAYDTYRVEFRAYYHAAFDHALYKSGTRSVMTEEKVRELLGWDEDVPSTVTLSDSAYPLPSRGAKSGDYDVYIDGIRIYNTMGTLSYNSGDTFATTENAEGYAAHAIYTKDKESNPKYFNVRNYLVDVTKDSWFKELGTTDAEGMLYIAGKQEEVGEDETFVGITIGMSGQIYTEAKEYKEGSTGEIHTKYYLLKEDGTRITDRSGKYYIFRYSKNNKFYMESNPWTVLSYQELMQEVGNEIAFYDNRYEAIGPEFEVYLAKDGGVAFNATDSASSVTAVHISLRSANGGSIAPQLYNGTNKTWESLTVAYPTERTEQYYDVTSYAKSNGGNIYIRNAGEGIMSLINVKVVGGSVPKVNTRMIIDATKCFAGFSETPVADEGMTLNHSLNLASDIALNYMIPESRLGEVQDSYLTVTLPVYEGNTLVSTEERRISPVYRDGIYYYTLQGLTAVDMNDLLYARLHYLRDGVHYVTEEDEYSIGDYAYAQLGKSGSSDALKKLCAQLLRYGAEAQLYKEHRTDILADSLLTEAQRAYLADLETVEFGSLNSTLSDLTDPSVNILGKALSLDSRVSLLFIVDPGDYAAEDLRVRVRYTDSEGQEQLLYLEDSSPYGGSYLSFCLDALTAAELRTALELGVYNENEEQLSNHILYSADTYGNNKTGQLRKVCQALFAYSDAARDFFKG